jgi:hypothetical protein
MASNSRREQVLAKVKTTLEGISGLTDVVRKPLTSITELRAFSSQQLPIAVVVGGLPVPEEKFSQRTRKLDLVQSTLSVNIIVYALDNLTPDTTISSLADDVWATFYTDITLGFEWVLGLKINPEMRTSINDPYIAFAMELEITYLHGKGGI